ncbi:1-phosphofructokinase [Paludibacterium yongneupense]|uniref:1-phosphofructokinase n=1 Tax=Paludibacterium yongneupense TaxID=400061 RepID=UPI0004299C00|nr:1-phosphofructokinase [Paludibacterium yongneupense]
MSQTIVTVTLNPAIDQTVILDALRPGAVNPARAVTFNAGGKGVNVAGCLADWKASRIVATGLLGRGNADVFETMFRDKDIVDAFIRQEGLNRVNIKLVDSSNHDTTDINLPAGPTDSEAFPKLLERLQQLAGSGHYFVLSGSLPTGLPDDTYIQLLQTLRERGAWVLLDTSGEALGRVLRGPAASLPMCIKPNRSELEQLTGRALPTLSDVAAEAAKLLAQGIEKVVVSLGGDGALFVDADGAWHAQPLPLSIISTVGAGDAMVAGLIAGISAGQSWPDCARLAVAFASGKLAQIGPHLPEHKELERLAHSVQLARLEN